MKEEIQILFNKVNDVDTQVCWKQYEKLQANIILSVSAEININKQNVTLH